MTKMRAPDLMESMKQTAKQAKEWRSTFFFDEQPVSPDAPTSMRFETLA
jgi:hypothetical protein